MSDKTESLQRVQDTLKQLGTEQPLKIGVKELLNALGYVSTRTLDVGSVADFLQRYQDDGGLTEPRRNLFNLCKQIDMVFQFTVAELKDHAGGIERLHFDSGRVESFLFFAIDMVGTTYTRSQLSEIARSVNGFFSMPVILIFRHGSTLTLAVVHRRQDRRREDRDVLEKVTLVKDIRIENPHRAHTDFLSSLDLARLIESGARSFDDLHEKWEAALDVEALNKRFYGELFQWFELAVDSCRFPDDGAGEGSDERHIIRMITRLLFIWFMKEKHLVPECLFQEGFARTVLQRYESGGSDYYKAVLQNLFFATLNTEIGARSFVSTQNSKLVDSNKYHYRELIADSDTLVEQLRNVPFVNGGLFDPKSPDKYLDSLVAGSPHRFLEPS